MRWTYTDQKDRTENEHLLSASIISFSKLSFLFCFYLKWMDGWMDFILLTQTKTKTKTKKNHLKQLPSLPFPPSSSTKAEQSPGLLHQRNPVDVWIKLVENANIFHNNDPGKIFIFFYINLPIALSGAKR